ncbi:hypothetical protein [Nubsella zeaxanthinifaciens]|uniref:hypothetical protein n=1 Tax=Nubsella zeaxanthinifaciens TaxID=392412 RepID=UPI0013007B62|nr:hypothetical protein [Nubsella zeaxanthinifaciens]
MENKKIKLEIRKVGTFKKSHATNAVLFTSDPTSELTSVKTTMGPRVQIVR